MSGDGREELREALAAILTDTGRRGPGFIVQPSGPPKTDWAVFADALLPVVVDNMRRYAALHLRDAAAATVAATWPYPLVGADGPTVSEFLRDRADALCGLRTGAEGERGVPVTPQDGSGAYRANQGEV